MVPKKKKSARVNISIPSSEISNGILALKKITEWPEEGNNRTPIYSDESATIYLQFVPKTMDMSLPTGPKRSLVLPHPLSYNRSVCFIAPETVPEDDQRKMSKVLGKLGVQGNIKMVPLSLVETAAARKDQASLAMFAQLFDTHLAEKNADQLHHALDPALAKFGKCLHWVDFSQGRKRGFREALATTALLVNCSEDAYVLKVAHTGLTDTQIEDNIQCALDYFQHNPEIYRRGLKSFKSVHLKCGDAEGVPIYVGSRKNSNDSSCNEDVPPVDVAEKNKEAGESSGGCSSKNVEPSKQANIQLTKKSIRGGILALKTLVVWPLEGDEQTPSFSDDSASIYLEIQPREDKMSICTPGPNSGLALPHPLSLKRDVCFIARDTTQDVENLQEAALFVKNLINLGVKGEIEIVLPEMITTAVENNDHNALKNLAELFDTHLVDERVPSRIHKLLKAVLQEHGKRYYLVGSTFQGKDLRETLSKSTFIVTSSENSLVFKVAQTCLSDAQIEENIEEVLNFICSNGAQMFEGGLTHIESIRLKIGDHDGVFIYANYDDFEGKSRRIAEEAWTAKKATERAIEKDIEMKAMQAENIQKAMAYMEEHTRKEAMKSKKKHFTMKVSEAALHCRLASQIAEGVSALKTFGVWPKHGEQSTPVYSDESTSIYLLITPERMHDGYQRGNGGDVVLPHALSYNRGVCFFGGSEKEICTEITAALHEFGIKGKIKVPTVERGLKLFQEKEKARLVKVVKQYDTFIARGEDFSKLHVMAPTVIKFRKLLLVAHGLKQDILQKLFARSGIFWDSPRGVFEIKIAHTSHTDSQIQENIQQALNYVLHGRNQMYLKKLSAINSIRLKLGNSECFTIDVHSILAQAEAEVKSRLKSQNWSLEPALSRKSSNVTSPAAYTSRQNGNRKIKRESNLGAWLDEPQKRRKESAMNMFVPPEVNETLTHEHQSYSGAPLNGHPEKRSSHQEHIEEEKLRNEKKMDHYVVENDPNALLKWLNDSTI